MARITLTINGNINDVQRKIAVIKSDLKSLEQFKIRISVDASGVQALDKSVLKSVDSFAKLTNAQARLKESENALAIQSEKTRQAEIKLEAQRERTMRSMQNQREETDRLKQSSESLLNNIIKNGSWYLISGFTSAAVRSLKDAVSTMKAVEQQLKNIEKLGTIPAEEISRIGDSAYETASKFGIAADKYLESVYRFQKAGLSDNSEEMAQLATKITLVGDTTQEIADTFLISANAAWKFGGDIERLSYLIDAADKLNNNYAVSLGDIATALPIVGATAAQVGLTAEQTMSAVSAIVATTGQSASKAATAFRAILMNLIGETGTLEDGISVTEESIASLNAVLNKYASESLRAAEAQGKILDPMEAVAALAKAAEDGFLNEAQLFEVLSGLGGKLRTTQLAALVNNMELYNAMLRDTADAAGTADAEVSVMLTSWESKSQILANTWAQFVSHVVSTDAVKTGLDVVTAALGALDNKAGQSVASILAASAGLTTLIKLSQQGAKWLGASGMVGGLKEFARSLRNSQDALSAFTTLWNASPFAVVAIGVTAIAAAVAIADALNVTIEERLALLDEASRKYDEEAGALDALNGKLTENQKLLKAANEEGASEAYKNRLSAENEELERQITLQEERVRLAKEEEGRQAAALLLDKNRRITTTVIRGHDEAVEMAEDVDILTYAEHLLEVSEAEGKVNDELLGLISTLTDARDKLDPLSDAYGVYAGRIDAIVSATSELTRAMNADTNLSGIAAAVNEINDVMDRGSASTAVYVQSLTDITTRYAVYHDSLTAAKEAGRALSEQEQEFIRIYGVLQFELNRLTKTTDEHTDATESAQDAADKLAKSASATSAALKDFEEYGNLTTDSMNGLTEAMGDSLDALFDETGALTKAGQAAFETASEFTSAKDAVEYLQTAAQAANYANLIAQIQAAGTAAVISTQQIAAMLQAVGLSANIADAQARGMALTAKYNGTSAQSELLGYLNAQAAALKQQTEEIARSATKSGSTGSTSSKGSGGGSSDKEKDEELEALKAAVSLEKQRLSFLEASKASDDERIAKMRDIQAALHAQAEYLHSIGASEEEIKALSTEWWTIQNKITAVYDEQAKAEKKLAEDKKKEREEAEKAAKQAFYDYANAQKKALEAARDAALKPLQEQLDALNAQRSAVEEQRKEQERLLAVEQARAALEKAQNQRNVRQFNADTQQWEWVADSREIEDAKKAVIDAEKALSDYHAERLYQAQKKAIEDQIAATKEAFEAQRDAWTEAAELVRSGAMSIAEAMAYAQQAVQSAASQIQSAASWAATSASAGSGASGGVSASSGGFFSGSTGYGGNYTRPDMSRNEALAGKTVYTDGFNVTYDENGYATKAVNPNHSNYEGTTMSAHAQSKEDALAGKDFTPDYSGLYDWNNGSPDYSKKYDSGGVLHGMGGIKETAEDELILPPDLTKAVLSPALTQNVANQLEKLGVLTGARPMSPGFSMPQASTSSIGTQNNNCSSFEVYMNGFPIPNVNAGTTLGEIARVAKEILPIHRS